MRDKRVFDYLLKLDVVRGPHSTGVARIRATDNETELVKGVGTTWHLIQDKPDEYYNDKKKDFIIGNHKVLIGHNRWATVGDVTEANAHPFVQGNITGAHNGTLDQHCLAYRMEDADLFQTDSECVMHNINILGIEKTIPKMSGAWALTWYNKEDDTFNILRNKERPLCYAWSKDKKVFYYASEAWMLHAAFDKFNVETAGDVFLLAKDTHYKFDMSGNMGQFGENLLTKSPLEGWQPPKYEPVIYTGKSNVHPFRSPPVSPRELAKEMEKKIGFYVDFCVQCLKRDEHGKDYIAGYIWNKPQIEVRVYENNRATDLYQLLDDDKNEEFYGKVKKVKTVPSGVYVTLEHDTIGTIEWTANQYSVVDSQEVLDDAIPFDEDAEDDDFVIYGYDGVECSSREFDEQVKNGCSWCSVVPDAYDCEEIKWIDRETFLCEDCQSDGNVSTYVQHMTK